MPFFIDLQELNYCPPVLNCESEMLNLQALAPRADQAYGGLVISQSDNITEADMSLHGQSSFHSESQNYFSHQDDDGGELEEEIPKNLRVMDYIQGK